MFSTEEIARVTGGELVGGDVKVKSVSTDTRTLERGALFIAVKGERFDGNDYIRHAAENGAAAAISDLAAGTVKTAIPVIYVKNSRTAQLKLARYYRDKFDLKLCGVTGSVGKTSTKDMISAVLSAKYGTLKTEGNYNNDIGLPKTLFRLDKTAEAAVIEMGMSGRGEISELSKTAHPTCAVITNIGYCHIENLKTRENILAAKLEILDGMDENSPLIVYGGDEYLGKLTSEDVGGRRLIRFGLSEECGVYASGITQSESGGGFTLHCNGSSYKAAVPAVGEHHILNALAAFCVGIEFGLSPEEIIPAFMSYESSGMRQKIERRGNDIRVILDCYNASPTSMRPALSVLKAVKTDGRRIAVLGDMLELGDKSKALHAAIAEYAAEYADMFFLYGREMTALRDELKKRGIKAFHSENKGELTELLLGELKSGDAVLFKGSRGMKMEEIAEKIE
ncbi:MAG: UDP-N-acetylmuramoyl-tripeptide--D-alanyl-D-alanine ligase [Lachnospiraceae bacterium]|nr:UDP-N-acetylmuramoyl-tripeptide--D-alanyl-D-alanine ligase [Ruminococcus sp.]MCM1275941.1 UDP-N-acetylmuramoyl-tripeptide--D-alanyl-D-alanine ligase [Lachnospiraceae bacterium]